MRTISNMDEERFSEMEITMVTKNDCNWVQRLTTAGHERDLAIEELRSILFRGMTAIIRARYDNKVQADDVVQEAMLKILDKLDTFQGRSKFTTWAMSIATRIAVSSMRRKHFADVSLHSLTENRLDFEPSATEEIALGTEQEKERVLKKLRELIDTELTSRQSAAVHALLDGMPVEVFAEKTGSNRNAVYKLVHDARAKLRKGLEQSGFMADDVSAVFA